MSDYRARNWRATIYLGETGSPLEFSLAVTQGPPIKGNSFSNVGYSSVECQFVLRAGVLSESLDTRRNGIRWAKGNRIIIEVADSSGNYVQHRTLYLIKAKYDDGFKPSGEKPETPTLTLQCGDRFKLLESRYPPQDLSRVYASTDISLLAALNHWLQYFGLDEITTVSGDPVPTERINFTVRYPGNLFPMEFIGRLAYAVSRYTLWVDPQNRIRLARVELDPATADYTLDAAEDCFIWNRTRQDSEEVAGTVRVLGTTDFVYPYTDPPSNTSTTTTANLTTTETVSVFTTPLSREITKTSTTSVSGFSGGTSGGGATDFGQSVETTTKNYGGGTADVPNPNPAFPSTPGIPDHLLSQIINVQEQLPAPGGGSGASLGPLQDTRQTEIDYYYKVKNTVLTTGAIASGVELYKIVTTTKRFDPSNTTLGSGGGLSVDSIKTQYWLECGPDLYAYFEATIFPTETENRRSSSSSLEPGTSSPPKPENAPALLVPQQIAMFGIARFNYPIGAPNNDKPRDLDYGQFLPSYDAAEEHAKRDGAIIIGRSEGQDIGCLPSDAWLADPTPFPTFFVVDEFGEQQAFIGDMPVLLLGDRACYLAVAGIWLGQRSGGVITPPYELEVDYLAYEDGSSSDSITDEDGNLIEV